MVLFLMLFSEINVVHLATSRAFLDISPAITEMSGHFTLGELLQAIIASLQDLFFHQLELFISNSYSTEIQLYKLIVFLYIKYQSSHKKYYLQNLQSYSSGKNISQIYLQQKVLMIISDTQRDEIIKKFIKISQQAFNKKYEREMQQLGKGSYGVVWKAKTLQGNYVAIKEFHAYLAQKIIRLIGRQIDNLKALKHQHIVKFYDCYFVEQKHYCIVMEYCPAGDLSKQIENKLTDHRKLTICTQIADALAYAHEKNIVHRDLKPANVLVWKDGICKVADFGHSIQMQREDQNYIMSSSVGSPAYRDFRIMLGEEYDQSVDVYSLGMVILSVYEGKGIYDDCGFFQLKRRQNALLNNYEAQIRIYIRNLPPLIHDIVKNCLNPRHQLRYKAKEIFNQLKNSLLQMKNPSLSKIKSTIDQETVLDEESVFAYKLIYLTKKLDYKQRGLSSKRKILEIFSQYQSNMSKIHKISTLKYVQPQTKSQFVTYLIFYYLFWINQLSKLIHGQNSAIASKYKTIDPKTLDKPTISKFQAHINSQIIKYHPFMIKSCREMFIKLNLMSNHERYLPSNFKHIVEQTCIGAELDYSKYDDSAIKRDLMNLYQKRIKKQFQQNSGPQFTTQLQNLLQIKSIIQDFEKKV